MANFNLFNSLDNIYNNKLKWEDANKKNDEEGKKQAAEAAKQHYWQMRQNGYDNVANEINLKDSAGALGVRNYWGKAGKTEIRPFLSKLAGQYNDSTGKKIDINDYLDYNPETGEVSLGGRNIGRPYSEIDGVTRWDPADLEKSFKTFTNDIGASMSDEQAYNTSKNKGLDYLDDAKTQMNQDYDNAESESKKLRDKYYELYGDNMNMNPLDTSWGKAIKQNYGSMGATAANNAVASSVGSNGGNIDSYAAANAARQNIAYENAGNNAVLDMFNSKVSNAYNVLQGLGVEVDKIGTRADNRFNNGLQSAQMASDESQRFFDNNQTTKNNEVSRDSAIAEMTGYIDPKYLKKYNPYFNSDTGEVNTDIDYKSEIDRLTAENDALEAENKDSKDELQKTKNSRRIAENNKKIEGLQFGRTYKAQLPDYQKYAGDVLPITPMETGSMRLGKETLKNTASTNATDNATKLAIANAEGKTAENIANTEGKTAENIANANNDAAQKQLEYMTENGVDANGNPVSGTLTKEQKEYNEKLSKNFESAIKSVNDYLKETYGDDTKKQISKMSDGKYSKSSNISITDVGKVVKDVNYLNDEEKYLLLKTLGFNDQALEAYATLSAPLDSLNPLKIAGIE